MCIPMRQTGLNFIVCCTGITLRPTNLDIIFCLFLCVWQHQEGSQSWLGSGNVPPWPTGPMRTHRPLLMAHTLPGPHPATLSLTLLQQVGVSISTFIILNLFESHGISWHVAHICRWFCRWLLPQPSDIWCGRRPHGSPSLLCSYGPAAPTWSRSPFISSRYVDWVYANGCGILYFHSLFLGKDSCSQQKLPHPLSLHHKHHLSTVILTYGCDCDQYAKSWQSHTLHCAALQRLNCSLAAEAKAAEAAASSTQVTFPPTRVYLPDVS